MKYPRDFLCHLVGGIYDHAQTHCLTAIDPDEIVCTEEIKVFLHFNLLKQVINKKAREPVQFKLLVLT